MIDYEKKYNEALELARKAYNSISPENYGARRIIEDAFPELRESEDERIRNCIRCLTSLDQAQDVIADMGFTRQDILAYLEKQKDINCLADTNTPDKPAEWSEEDEKMRYYVTEAVQFRYSDRELAKYLDLKIINGQKQLKQKLFDWLRDLRPQPKKELSIEKAIQWLDDTFYFLDNSSGRGRDCEITTRDFDSLEEMYDSFRKAVTIDSQPHWKPSEEQMEALRRAVNKLANTDVADSVRLSIMYDNLKKLM